MSEIKRTDLMKIETLSLVEYSEKYGDGVSPQALSYAINNDKIDFTWIGNERFIVMTEKTKEYTPNASPKRKGSTGTMPVRK